MKIDKENKYLKSAIILSGVVGLAVIARAVHGRMNMLDQVSQAKQHGVVTLRGHIIERMKAIPKADIKAAAPEGYRWDTVVDQLRELDVSIRQHHIALKVQNFGSPEWSSWEWTELFESGMVDGQARLSFDQLIEMRSDFAKCGPLDAMELRETMNSVAAVASQGQQELADELGNLLAQWDELAVGLDTEKMAEYLHIRNQEFVGRIIPQMDVVEHASFTNLQSLEMVAHNRVRDWAIPELLRRDWTNLPNLSKIEQKELDEAVRSLFEIIIHELVNPCDTTHVGKACWMRKLDSLELPQRLWLRQLEDWGFSHEEIASRAAQVSQMLADSNMDWWDMGPIFDRLTGQINSHLLNMSDNALLHFAQRMNDWPALFLRW